MKVYFYHFDKTKNKVIEEIISARKYPKYFSIQDGEYAGITHHGLFKYYHSDERKIKHSGSEFFFSYTPIDIETLTPKWKEFIDICDKRQQILNELRELIVNQNK